MNQHFPPTDGISTTINSISLVAGLQVNYKTNCHIQFGSYFQIYKEHDNGMGSLLIGTISLQEIDNSQQGHYFIILDTLIWIYRHFLTYHPIINEDINLI